MHTSEQLRNSGKAMSLEDYNARFTKTKETISDFFFGGCDHQSNLVKPVSFLLLLFKKYDIKPKKSGFICATAQA